jgi:hypothetical protein
MYHVEAARSAGAFTFWRYLPVEHSGEDLLAQLRIMAKYGECGLFPSGVYHLELPTTVVDRHVDAPKSFGLFLAQRPKHVALLYFSATFAFVSLHTPVTVSFLSLCMMPL